MSDLNEILDEALTQVAALQRKLSEVGARCDALNAPQPAITRGEYAAWSSRRFVADERLGGAYGWLFETPRGACGQGFVHPLSWSETNVVERGIVPAGYTMIVRAMNVEVFGSPEDRKKVAQGSILIEARTTVIPAAPIGAICPHGAAWGQWNFPSQGGQMLELKGSRTALQLTWGNTTPAVEEDTIIRVTMLGSLLPDLRWPAP